MAPPQPTAAGSIAGRTALLTPVAMIAFAANSVLTRLALAPGLIDAPTFASVRVVAAAATLWLILALRGRRGRARAFDPRMTMALLIYVVGFTFAYLSLSTGTGALILFGAVQLAMLSAAFRGGERFAPPAWLGLGLAVAGMVYLVAPGVEAPEPWAALSMALAGVAWGVYSLLGRGAKDPLAATAANFLLCCPAVLLVNALFWDGVSASLPGLALAAASGALASGLGYVVWYAALAGLSAGRASAVQLSVPAIAAFGGVVLLAEPVTARLVLASAATLGGIALVLASRPGRPSSRD